MFAVRRPARPPRNRAKVLIECTEHLCTGALILIMGSPQSLVGSASADNGIIYTTLGVTRTQCVCFICARTHFSRDLECVCAYVLSLCFSLSLSICGRFEDTGTSGTVFFWGGMRSSVCVCAARLFVLAAATGELY